MLKMANQQQVLVNCIFCTLGKTYLTTQSNKVQKVQLHLHLQMHLHIKHMHTKYIRIHLNKHILYISTYIYIPMSIHTHINIYIYIFIYVCVYVCVFTLVA